MLPRKKATTSIHVNSIANFFFLLYNRASIMGSVWGLNTFNFQRMNFLSFLLQVKCTDIPVDKPLLISLFLRDSRLWQFYNSCCYGVIAVEICKCLQALDPNDYLRIETDICISRTCCMYYSSSSPSSAFCNFVRVC